MTAASFNPSSGLPPGAATENSPLENSPREGSQSAKAPPVKLPLPLLAAALVAMGMLYITAEGFAGLLICAGLLALSQITNRRLSNGWALALSLRVLALAAIGALVGFPRSDLSGWYVKAEYTRPLGCLLAAELTLRCWQYAAPARRRPTLVVALVLTCLIFSCGVDTYDVGWAQWLTPVFVGLLALALRSLSKIDAPVPPSLAPKTGRAVRWRSDLMRGAVLAGALGIGFFSVVLINRLNDSMDSLLIRLSSHTHRPISPMGMSNAPHLQASFGGNDATGRILLIDGAASELYLRCAAYETFSDNRWTPTLENRTFSAIPDNALRGKSSGRPITITRLTNVSDILLVPLDCSSVDATGPFQRDDEAGIEDKAAITNLPYSFYLPPPGARSVSGKPFPYQGPICAPVADTTRQKLLALPPTVDPRVIALAKQVAGIGDPWTRAVRLMLYLTSHHHYSLQFEPHGDDALNDFILNNRDAHCQYFASALAVMCRAVGIPARYVTGYYAHEKYGFGQMIVRSRDAHAWTEVLIDGAGWATLDATPASGLPEALYPDVSPLGHLWERLLDSPRALRVWLTTRTQRQLLTLAALACAGFSLLWLAQHLWRRWRTPRLRPRAPVNDPLESAARRFDAWLARHGVACPAGATWRDCIAAPSAPQAVGAARGRCGEFLDAYDAARFGPPPLAQQIQPRVNALLDALEQSNLPSKASSYASN